MQLSHIHDHSVIETYFFSRSHCISLGNDMNESVINGQVCLNHVTHGNTLKIKIVSLQCRDVSTLACRGTMCHGVFSGLHAEVLVPVSTFSLMSTLQLESRS